MIHGRIRRNATHPARQQTSNVRRIQRSLDVDRPIQFDSSWNWKCNFAMGGNGSVALGPFHVLFSYGQHG